MFLMNLAIKKPLMEFWEAFTAGELGALPSALVRRVIAGRETRIMINS